MRLLVTAMHHSLDADAQSSLLFERNHLMHSKFVRSLPLVLLLAGQGAGAATCIPLSGFVRLDPDPNCRIVDRIPTAPFNGECYSVSLRGPIGTALIGSGSAGLTSESILNGGGTPSAFNETGFGVSRQFFTARSAINILGGQIFTSDAGVRGALGATEQLLVVGGTGFWANASGAIYARGNIVQNWGPFNAQVCRP
jgi:hypothetical protein